ncbi:hypothetical protein I3760_06G002500 [Carya illinoinensis]|nr:hypothetical protein I3760_06G002500 [Carya illinoinensis]
MNYLGLPLGAASRAIPIWDIVIKKIELRLVGWKGFYLSKGGRITIIKSTLSNLPTYFLSLFLIPVSVATHNEKLYRDFLWSGLGNEFKFHLVKWDKVCSPISSAGLGIRNLRISIGSFLGNICGDTIKNQKLYGSRRLTISMGMGVCGGGGALGGTRGVWSASLEAY